MFCRLAPFAGRNHKRPGRKDNDWRPNTKGADAVVRKEDASEENGRVRIGVPPKKSEYIRFRGEDIRAGGLILSSGDLVGPAETGVLASIGRLHAMVAQRPLAAVIATGDEIVEPGDTVGPHSVISSNSFTLDSLLRSCGATPVYLGIASDTEASLRGALERARRCDLILTSGGVSVGDFDLVRTLMEKGGNRLFFRGVEIRPGKPLAFGEMAGIPAFGLPGNPVSTMTTFYQFVRPAVLKMQGAREILLPRIRARLATRMENTADRPHFMRGVLRRMGDDLVVGPTGPQGSGILTSMARGNCFIILPKGKTILEEGSPVECEMYRDILPLD